jgi:hypothetical protein
MLTPAPQVEENEVGGINVPDDVENFDAAMRSIDEMFWIHEAIMRTHAEYGDLIPGAWNPMGPEGGLVGGSWTITNSASKD